MKFSVIVVCLNPGEKLNMTVSSVLRQTYGDYEILIQDGMSEDGSIEMLPHDERIRIFREKDEGIYDGMNRAVERASGEYLHFLNCGDVYHDENVLKKIASFIDIESAKEGGPLLAYGDIYNLRQDSFIQSNPAIDGFACYRNLPCHQACFYDRSLFAEHRYNTDYVIRADYEHFLYCFYKTDCRIRYAGVTVASYEGGGFSETKENVKLSRAEHRAVTQLYMEPKDIRRYRLILALTLAPLRKKFAESRGGAAIYNKAKSLIYHTGRKE